MKTLIQRAARSFGFEIRRVGRSRSRLPIQPSAGSALATTSVLPQSTVPVGAPPGWTGVTRSPLLPVRNADGLPVVEMTLEQKYVFDVKGWLCLPGLIRGSELQAVREHVLRFHCDRRSLAPGDRYECGAAAQGLLDHPVVVGILNEILSHQPVASEECYGFRLENTFSKVRRAGDDNFGPHNGGGLFGFSGDSHVYQNFPGRVYSGLTRVVWELNDVGPGDGATQFISGSQKAAFERPSSTELTVGQLSITEHERVNLVGSVDER